MNDTQHYIFIETKQHKLRAKLVKEVNLATANSTYVQALQAALERRTQEWDKKTIWRTADGRIALRSTLRARIKYAIGQAPIIWHIRQLLKLPKHYALQ